MRYLVLIICTISAFHGSVHGTESSESANFLPERKCVFVHVDELFRDYAGHDGERICTIGHVHGHVGSVSLWPYDKELTIDESKLIELHMPYWAFISKGLKSGYEFFIEGEFSYNKKCFEKNSSGEHETICAPLQYPMYLEDITVSSLAKVWP
jgi:hypothetical protein